MDDRDPYITDHPYQPTAWPDTCGHAEDDGWFCGYAESEHADPRGNHA
jgi:hypothetical protein